MTVEHTEEIKVEALAALDLNHGNVAKTAREIAVPRSTLGRWRDAALEAGDGRNLLPVEGDWGEWRERAADAYLRTALKTQVIMEKNIDRLRDEEMSVMDLQRLSITLGTLTDKANHLRGNVVPAVAIDARHQAVLALDGASLADLQALLVQAEAAAEAPESDPRQRVGDGGQGASGEDPIW